MFLLPTVTYAISAQWDLDPISGDWNTAANWTPNGVPNGPADVATFGPSGSTNVLISEDTEVNGIIFTLAAPYNIFVTDVTLTISGLGITNNSGNLNLFRVGEFGSGQIRFTNSSTAGNVFNAILSDGFGSTTNFFDSSTAGTAAVSASGGATTNFFDSSTAGNSFITAVHGATNFFDRSTAGSAAVSALDMVLSFFDNSSAGSATIFATDNFGLGFVRFADFSTAGSATIIWDSNLITGGIFFEDFSQGGTARIEFVVNPGLPFVGSLDISAHNAPGVTIGSIEGDGGNVFLGANNLTVGSNNLSTTFSGVIQDFGFGGSLTKIGIGTLILSGANTYTGDTNVNRGVLQVDGSITSNTFVNHAGTLAGTGTINGNVTNNGKVSPGSAGSPGMLSVTGNYTQAQYTTLMIQIAGTNTGDFSVLNVLGNANLSGFLDPVLLNGFVPTLGDSFTFLKYASWTGGGFQILNPVFNHGTEQWSVAYLRNRAILTVEQHVPDQGSTFLLLTLGLLGLVTFRRQLLRGQP
jgi:autotransporter-associated beta strand protein